MLDDRTGELRDTHPLRFRFAERDRVVDLDRDTLATSTSVRRRRSTAPT